MNDFKKDENWMPDSIFRGMQHLMHIFNEVNEIVIKTKQNNSYYQYPSFIFRGIKRFYSDTGKPSEKNEELSTEKRRVESDTIKSSLAVRLKNTSKDLIKNGNYSRAFYVNALEDIIRKAKNMYPGKYVSEMTDLDLLADIQHNGGATCLVDFSKNLLTAIWFACSGDQEYNGFYCYDIMEDMIKRDALVLIRPEDEHRKISVLLSQTYKETNVCSDVDIRFCLWEPSKKNNRMIRQDSVFVFGIEKFKLEDHGVYVVGIKAEWKSDILTAMKSIFNISGNAVYNDHIGFANNINKFQPYTKLLDSNYNRGYTNMIRGHYTSALDFLKLAEIEITNDNDNSESGLKRRLELHFSLGVCYKSLGRQNETIHYLENALSEYKKAIKLAKIIAKNETNPSTKEYYVHKAVRGYNARVSLMYKLMRFDDAINECIEIIKNIEQWKTDEELKSRNLTSRYCKVSILELRDLAIIKYATKKKSDTIKQRDRISKSIEDYSLNVSEKNDFNFMQLLKEYYDSILELLFCETDIEQFVEDKISNWEDKATLYFKNDRSKNDTADYILWNFADIKNIIDSIDTDSWLFKYKVALQNLTAGVISLRDAYEMNGWWSFDRIY